MAIRDLSNNNNEGSENSGKYLIDLNTGYQWSEEQKAYMEWLCLPRRKKIRHQDGRKEWDPEQLVFRNPSTEIALAEKLGVARPTLWTWKQNPRWPEALMKMRMLVEIKLEPVIGQIKLINMLKASGWQERLGDDRYSRPARQELLRIGYLDEVKGGTAISKANRYGNREQALSMFAQFPPAQQQALMEYLEAIEAVEPQQQVTAVPIEVAAYAWDDESDEEANEQEVIELLPEPEPEQLLSVTQRRNRRLIRPDEDDPTEEIEEIIEGS
jgi:hypothetical protein